MKDLSILVLAYNEAANLRGAVAGIQRAAACLDDYEIVIVNDGSEDATGDIADAIAAENNCVRAVHHCYNRGLRAGYETGLSEARMSWAVWLPADGEMATDSIWAIFAAVGAADLVVPYHGTPARRAWLRRLLTWGSTTQLNWLLGHDLNYYQGTVVYPTALARRLPRTVPGFFFCAEMLAHALDEGLSYVEVPLEHVERQHGVSKAVSWGAVWRAQTLILGLWWRLRVQAAFQALGWALEHR